jgi:hypothetical protein
MVFGKKGRCMWLFVLAGQPPILEVVEEVAPQQPYFEEVFALALEVAGVEVWVSERVVAVAGLAVSVADIAVAVVGIVVVAAGIVVAVVGIVVVVAGIVVVVAGIVVVVAGIVVVGSRVVDIDTVGQDTARLSCP